MPAWATTIAASLFIFVITTMFTIIGWLLKRTVAAQDKATESASKKFEEQNLFNQKMVEELHKLHEAIANETRQMYEKVYDSISNLNANISCQTLATSELRLWIQQRFADKEYVDRIHDDMRKGDEDTRAMMREHDEHLMKIMTTHFQNCPTKKAV